MRQRRYHLLFHGCIVIINSSTKQKEQGKASVKRPPPFAPVMSFLSEPMPFALIEKTLSPVLSLRVRDVFFEGDTTGPFCRAEPPSRSLGSLIGRIKSFLSRKSVKEILGLSFGALTHRRYKEKAALGERIVYSLFFHCESGGAFLFGRGKTPRIRLDGSSPH